MRRLGLGIVSLLLVVVLVDFHGIAYPAALLPHASVDLPQTYRRALPALCPVFRGFLTFSVNSWMVEHGRSSYVLATIAPSRPLRMYGQTHLHHGPTSAKVRKSTRTPNECILPRSHSQTAVIARFTLIEMRIQFMGQPPIPVGPVCRGFLC